MAERTSKTKNGGPGQERERHDWRHLSRLFEKLPPHATEAEMSLLGSVLIDPQTIGDVVMVLAGGDDFYKPANGTIYDAMVELYNERSTLDIVQLHQLLGRPRHARRGGRARLPRELADAVAQRGQRGALREAGAREVEGARADRGRRRDPVRRVPQPRGWSGHPRAGRAAHLPHRAAVGQGRDRVAG